MRQITLTQIFLINDILVLEKIMAELYLKNSMEFFYIEDEYITKLLDELENRYKYQKILFVGTNKSQMDLIVSQKQRHLFYIFEDNFNSSMNDVSSVICFDKKLISECKSYCHQNKINYILVLDSYVSIDNFCLYKGINQLLGVVINKEKIHSNFKEFVYDFIIDCAQINFLLTEYKINQLYFCDEKIENLSKKCEKIQEIINFFNNIYNFQKNFEKILDYYFDLIMLFYNQNNCYLSKICLESDGYSNLVKTELVLSIYSMFLSRSTPFLMKSASGGITNSNFLFQFNEEKFWFINDKFKLDVINVIKSTLNNLENIKTICARIDMERMFDEAKNMELSNFKKQIFDVSSCLEDNSLIKIINYFGMLNF